LNERQSNVLNRLLDGFEGKLTTSKWATLATSLICWIEPRSAKIQAAGAVPAIH